MTGSTPTMKKPSYKNTYLSLVKKVNLDKIKHILNESGYYNEDIVEQIEYEEKDNFSYFILTVDSSELLRQGAYALLEGGFTTTQHPAPITQLKYP